MVADQEREEHRRKYEAALEPVVAEAAPKVTDQTRVLLGAVHDLVPSRTDEIHGVPVEDRLWFEALSAVTHRFGLTYELLGGATGRTLWLIPPPGTP